jgi:hypothetical protein
MSPVGLPNLMNACEHTESAHVTALRSFGVSYVA